MNKEMKKGFYLSSMTVLYVLSNIVGSRYVDVFGLVFSSSFVIYPLTYLFIMLINDTHGKKEAYRAILIAVLIQLFVLLGYLAIINLKDQVLLADLSKEVKTLFAVDLKTILSSLIAFMASNYLLIYTYDYFKKKEMVFLGSFTSILVTLIADGLIFLSLTKSFGDFDLYLVLASSRTIISLFYSFIVVGLFYLLKEKTDFGKKIINEIKTEQVEKAEKEPVNNKVKTVKKPTKTTKKTTTQVKKTTDKKKSKK